LRRTDNRPFTGLGSSESFLKISLLTTRLQLLQDRLGRGGEIGRGDFEDSQTAARAARYVTGEVQPFGGQLLLLIENAALL
jgi:hypothetical protein